MVVEGRGSGNHIKMLDALSRGLTGTPAKSRQLLIILLGFNELPYLLSPNLEVPTRELTSMLAVLKSAHGKI